MANNQKYSPLYLFMNHHIQNLILLMIMVIIVKKINNYYSFVEKYKVNGC